MGKNKKYYQKNNYHNPKKEEKKVTYDSLMHAKTISERREEDDFDKLRVIKYIAISAVLFAIIIGSLLLFRNM